MLIIGVEADSDHRNTAIWCENHIGTDNLKEDSQFKRFQTAILSEPALASVVQSSYLKDICNVWRTISAPQSGLGKLAAKGYPYVVWSSQKNHAINLLS